MPINATVTTVTEAFPYGIDPVVAETRRTAEFLADSILATGGVLAHDNGRFICIVRGNEQWTFDRCTGEYDVSRKSGPVIAL